MLNLVTPAKIHVYGSTTDMRKGVDGLSGIVRGEFGADPTDGSLFVFINRRRDRLKILFFDGGGYWLYYRILEAGTFEELSSPRQGCYLTIDSTELSMLLSGITLVGSSRRRKRFARKESGEAA